MLLQTPDDVIICYAAVSTKNAGNGWTPNIAARNTMYDIQKSGAYVQALAYAQVGGDGVWSGVQNYKVSP